MAIDKLDDLLKLVTGSTTHSTIADLDDKIIGTRGDNLRTNAVASGNFHSTTGVFTGRSGIPSDVTSLIERHEKLQEQITDLESRKVPADGLKKIAEKHKADLTEKAKKVFGDLGESRNKHTAALEAIATAEGDIGTKIEKKYQKELTTLSKKLTGNATTDKAINDEIEALNKNYEAVKVKTAEHFEKMKLVHSDHLANVETVKTDLAKVTGLNAEEHMGKAPAALTTGAKITEAQYKDLGIGGKFKANTSAAWKNSSGWKKGARVVGTGVGGILLFKGAKDFASGLGMGGSKMDENGQPVEVSGAGQLVKGAAEAGAGALAAYFSLTAGGKGHLIA